MTLADYSHPRYYARGRNAKSRLYLRTLQLERLLLSVYSSTSEEWIKEEIKALVIDGRRKPRKSYA